MCNAFPWSTVLTVAGVVGAIVLLLMYLDGYWTHSAAIRRAQMRAYNRLLNGTPRASDIDAARSIIHDGQQWTRGKL